MPCPTTPMSDPGIMKHENPLFLKGDLTYEVLHFFKGKPEGIYNTHGIRSS